MNRQGFPYIRLSSLHVQQGLCASLAVLVTLIGGQQLATRDQSSQAEATAHVVLQPAATQRHFSADSSSVGFTLAEVDETEIAKSERPPERWVF